MTALVDGLGEELPLILSFSPQSGEKGPQCGGGGQG